MNQVEFVDLFNSLPDWEEKYRYIMDRAGSVEMPIEYRTAENKIISCTSILYFKVTREPQVKIYAWGNSPISLGLAGIISDIFTGRELVPTSLDKIFFHTKTQLNTHLSAARNAALIEMLNKIIIS